MTNADHSLGDAPIEPKYREMMNKLARSIDHLLNFGKRKKETGFVLLVFDLNSHEGRCNYLSNARREDVVVLLREQLKRFEGAPDVTGRA